MLRLGHRLDRFLVMVDSDYHVDLLIDNQLTGKKWVALLKVDVGARRGGSSCHLQSHHLTPLSSVSHVDTRALAMSTVMSNLRNNPNHFVNHCS